MCWRGLDDSVGRFWVIVENGRRLGGCYYFTKMGRYTNFGVGNGGADEVKVALVGGER